MASAVSAGAPPRAADNAPARPDVFISYSRRDKDFVQGSLLPALVARGKDVWIDLEDIPPAADWRERVLEGAVAANALLFVLSPDSLASPVCAEELARAVAFKAADPGRSPRPGRRGGPARAVAAELDLAT